VSLNRRGGPLRPLSFRSPSPEDFLNGLPLDFPLLPEPLASLNRLGLGGPLRFSLRSPSPEDFLNGLLSDFPLSLEPLASLNRRDEPPRRLDGPDELRLGIRFL